jgi:hypothetical protein
MNYLNTFRSNTELVRALGEANAHLVWVLAMYLDESDLEALASECLTDGSNDKKIDFIHLDPEYKRILFAQGYFSCVSKDEAPANKASDLNTAAAWLMSGDLDAVPTTMRPLIAECRSAIQIELVESVELVYVHNLPESVNVKRLLTRIIHERQKVPISGHR